MSEKDAVEQNDEVEDALSERNRIHAIKRTSPDSALSAKVRFESFWERQERCEFCTYKFFGCRNIYSLRFHTSSTIVACFITYITSLKCKELRLNSCWRIDMNAPSLMVASLLVNRLFGQWKWFAVSIPSLTLNVRVKRFFAIIDLYGEWVVLLYMCEAQYFVVTKIMHCVNLPSTHSGRLSDGKRGGGAREYQLKRHGIVISRHYSWPWR